MHRGTYLMSANLLVTLVSGIGFWMLAAHLLTPAQIGIASAFLAPSNFLAIVFLLGANYGVLRFARELEEEPALLFSTIWLSGGASAVGSILCAGLILAIGIIQPLGGSPLLSILLYALLVSSGTIWTVCECAFVGLRAPWQVLARNIGFALVRIAFLVPFVGFGEVGLVVSFAAGTCLAAIFSIGLLRRHLHAPWSIVFTLWRSGLKRIIGFALPNHLVNLIASVPPMILPLIVLHVLGAETNGFFAVAWTVSSILRSVLTAASVTLLAEGARDRALVGAQLGKTIGFLICLVSVAALPMVVFPQFVLVFFGAAYVEANIIALRLFALSLLPAVLTTVYMARERVEHRVRFIIVLSVASCVLSTVLPYLGARSGGYTGFAVWYLISQVLLGLAVAPVLIRSMVKSTVGGRLFKRSGDSHA
jgi:O-antigen/teichoic acid export membrane protein